jgi:hypothetical protein
MEVCRMHSGTSTDADRGGAVSRQPFLGLLPDGAQTQKRRHASSTRRLAVVVL